MRNTLIPVALLLATACSGAETPADTDKKTDATDNGCDLAIDKLDGRTFVRQVDKTENPSGTDILARMKFFHDGTSQKVKYTVRSQASVYDYTCTSDPKGLTCLQDQVDYIEWCRALWVNTGGCEAKQMAQVLLMSEDKIPAEMTKAIDDQNAKFKKLKPEEVATMQKAYNNPNVQLRGKLTIHVNTKECVLSIKDMFQTMEQGKLREMENFVGSARFVESKKDLAFDHCKDAVDLAAVASASDNPKPGEGSTDWALNQPVTFKYIGKDAGTVDAGCTYSMDDYVGYEAVGKAVPVKTDGGKPDWSFSGVFHEKGPTAAHIVRYKACGGKPPEQINVACALGKAN